MFNVITISVACSASRIRVRCIVVWLGKLGLGIWLGAGVILAVKERIGVLGLEGFVVSKR